MIVISFAKPSTLDLLLFLTYYYVLVLLALLPFCRSSDTITVGTIVDPGGETLVSAGEIFELGFFTRNGSFGSRRYVGIWYYKSENRTYVWVANRNAPIRSPNTQASLAIVGGNLMIRDDERGPPIWSTGVDGSSNSSRLVKLMDSGNLVLSEEDGRTVWQSFDHPTDTFLPGMLMRPSFTLTSWAGADDPTSGKYTFQLDQGGTNKYEVKNDTDVLWESGVSGDFIPEDLTVISSFLFNSTKSSSRNSEFDYNNNTRLVMSDDGQVQFFKRDKIGMWALVWSEPSDKCSVFKTCGNYGICNSSSNNKSMCTCLEGFVATDRKSWDSGVFIGGCISNNGSACEMTDEKAQNFSLLKVVKIKAPDSQNPNNSEEGCRSACLGDCHCQAYSFEKPKTRSDNSICWTWSDDTILSNIEVLPLASSNSAESRDVYVRVPSSARDVPGNVVPHRGPLTKKEKKKPLFLIALAGAAIIIITVCSIFYARRKQGRKQGNRDNIRENLEFRLYDSEKRIKQWMDSQQFKEDDKTGIDVPFFNLDIILEATNNFSEENKLGRGGFGPVYKATFPGGQEIAVKRLLSGSGQGLVEFKNEVVLIAKLQHRNLVRLVGYCMREDEKMLLYEYMPNKSLDAFIFDRTRSMLLTWDVRSEIILGIARGLLYLHQDSRLRIIHRDLKTSNILLDEEMNPKISDFGLARIFEAKQTEASTQRIMGTFGYMPPEYVLDGLFSFKSDVFSFGVVMLEIISGRRNTGFYQTEGTLSLLTYAWELWKDNNALNLVDPAMGESFNRAQVLASINVALLCVQEDPTDRPTMSTVVFMLGSESASLPNPKEPAFAVKRSIYGSVSSSSRPESSLELSSTLEQGR